MACLDLSIRRVVFTVIPRLSRTQGRNLHVHIGLIHVGQNPFGKPPLSAPHIAYADQVAMPLVHFETQPKVLQVTFVTFKNA